MSNFEKFPPVIITDCPDYTQSACRRAIAEIVGRSPLLQNIASGTRTVIKVNLVTMLKPEKAATTHPALLIALVEYLRTCGAEIVIGDSPGGPFDKPYLSGVYRATGMTDAVQAGAALNWDFSVKSAQFPTGKVMKDFEYTAYLDRADLIINFCKLKSHGMMAMSCAVKNMFGAVPGLSKPAYHYRFPDHDRFADMLVDLNEYFCPALSIVDAVIGMEGNGPTMGTPRAIGAVLASESPYALDLVCAKLIGLTAADVPTLAAAYARSLAPETAEAVTVIGDIAPYQQTDFAVVRGDVEIENFLNAGTALGKLFNRAAKGILAARPQLRRAKCVGCKKCAGLCPADAIAVSGGRPRIDREKCIRCFCCQEFCPVGALEAKCSPLGGLILKRKK